MLGRVFFRVAESRRPLASEPLRKSPELPTCLAVLAAVLPEAEVHSRDLLAAHHALWVRCHTENVPLELLDVVAVVTDDTSKGCLSELSQLRWREDSWILIPKSISIPQLSELCC